jgi:hypothetical protein
MMKLNRKSSMIAIAVIAMMCVGIAYAAYWVHSDPVNVTLDYVVHMGDPVISGSHITLSAYVTNGATVLTSGTIRFYQYDGSAYTIWVGNGDIDGTGWARLELYMTENGNYYFEAFYNVP